MIKFVSASAELESRGVCLGLAQSTEEQFDFRVESPPSGLCIVLSENVLGFPRKAARFWASISIQGISTVWRVLGGS